MSKNDLANGKTQEERIADLEEIVQKQQADINRLISTTAKLWKRWQAHDNEVKREKKEREKKLAAEKKAGRQKISEDSED